MTSIHFIRHGLVNDPEDTFYGRLPGFPLSEEGQAQALHVALALTQYPVRAIYSSPLLRTQQTASVLAGKLSLPVVTDARINEVATHFEGKTLKHLLRYPPVAADYAETMEQIYTRMADFVRDVVSLYPSDHIVAVTHGGPIHILEMGLEYLPFTDWAYREAGVPPCGSDTLVTVDGEQITAKRLEL